MAKNKSRVNIKILISVILIIAGLWVGINLYNNSQKRPEVYPGSMGMNKTLLSVTPNPTYALNPNEPINNSYIIPSFADIVSPELDPILKLMPGVSTKKDVEAIIGATNNKNYDGEFSSSIKVKSNENDPEPSSAEITYYFSKKDVLTKIHYYNYDFSGTTVKDIESVMGTPNMIYSSSPSEANAIEYAYPSIGITFIFNLSDELKAFTMYPPKTFKQYVEEYEDMLPYDQHL